VFEKIFEIAFQHLKLPKLSELRIGHEVMIT
jgi:hypothetical protein